MNKKREAIFQFLSVLIAIAVALIVTFIIILCVSDEPVEALKTFITGPLSTKRRIGNVIEAMIPLIFTGQPDWRRLFPGRRSGYGSTFVKM